MLHCGGISYAWQPPHPALSACPHTPSLCACPPSCLPLPQVSLGPGVHEGRPLSVREKLDLCNATERSRLAFGKSGIHGWGLFARLPMKQDSMVTEYRWVGG